MILYAMFKVPIRDCNQNVILSGEDIILVSSRVPINSMTCEGPCVIPGAIGILIV